MLSHINIFNFILNYQRRKLSHMAHFGFVLDHARLSFTKVQIAQVHFSALFVRCATVLCNDIWTDADFFCDAVIAIMFMFVLNFESPLVLPDNLAVDGDLLLVTIREGGGVGFLLAGVDKTDDLLYGLIMPTLY